jgi:hypothetical protein
MSVDCAWCGAHYDAPGDSCEARFDLALAREFEDPAYGSVHHLTVPAFMLQHNRYSRAGWLWARNLIAAFVRDGLDPAEARRQQRAMLDSGERNWAITRGPTFEGFEQIAWSRTIADDRFDSAADYCADVRAWAAAVVDDSEAVVAALAASES